MPDIKCPNCGHEFPLEDALNDELKEAIEKEKQELRQQMATYKKQKEEELTRKETEWQQKAHADKVALQKQIEEYKSKKFELDKLIKNYHDLQKQNEYKKLKLKLEQNSFLEV